MLTNISRKSYDESLMHGVIDALQHDQHFDDGLLQSLVAALGIAKTQ